ncbi:unnamed protein product [Rotaria magnacalcarata]|uniref:Uncharacterized protein n=1 Tax=Rotaria magnacalcarata TaxID=392030 RepID=A0A816T127_9BILA|nr:unnamed protein product [Rotaria magnacalcarata]CAF2086991.1 unnamed protein product [Rotaria magnacalcarata]CAF4151982.1 unnamed protein product [Rotaria magnacalcarata]CAF4161624.1 unnamed protein product [Rotaria magnacalcarata]
MPWGYWNWIYCSVLISLGIILITFFILVILLCYCDKVFFSAVAKLFSINRCIIDIHHTVIRKNSTFNLSSAGIMKTANSISGILSGCRNCTGETFGITPRAQGPQPDDDPVLEKNTGLPIEDLDSIFKLRQRIGSTLPLINYVTKFLININDNTIPTLGNLIDSLLLNKNGIPQFLASDENNIIVKLRKLNSSPLLPKKVISQSLSYIEGNFCKRLQPLASTKLSTGTTAESLLTIENKVRDELRELRELTLSPINGIIRLLHEIETNIGGEPAQLTNLIFSPIKEIKALLQNIEKKSSEILEQLASSSIPQTNGITQVLEIIKGIVSVRLKELIDSPLSNEDESKERFQSFERHMVANLQRLTKETLSQRGIIERDFETIENNISKELRELASVLLSPNNDTAQSIRNIENNFNIKLHQLASSTFSAKENITKDLLDTRKDFTDKLAQLIVSELTPISKIKDFVEGIKMKFRSHLGLLNNIKSLLTKEGTFRYLQSNSEYERPALDMYGRLLSFNKRINKAFLTILTTIIISAAIISAFGSLFLATSSVYRDGPCPKHGPMECYSGDNHTYFECNTGEIVNLSVDSVSGTCFRWIARDMTTTDLTTQIGVTAGLLTALGSITECLIRIYLSALNKRLGVSIGIGRILAKTVGINRITAPTPCCRCHIPCRCGFFNLSQYKHPHMTVIVTFIYILVPLLIVPGIVLLYHFQLTVTLLTFVFLITFALVCVVGLSWIAIQDDETSANVPGGWEDVVKIINIIPRLTEPLPQSNSNDAEASLDA